MVLKWLKNMEWSFLRLVLKQEKMWMKLFKNLVDKSVNKFIIKKNKNNNLNLIIIKGNKKLLRKRKVNVF